MREDHDVVRFSIENSEERVKTSLRIFRQSLETVCLYSRLLQMVAKVFDYALVTKFLLRYGIRLSRMLGEWWRKEGSSGVKQARR